jgi:L-asparaginase/Glu-tRNA(Gln) amidotransferase subunit D
MKKILLLTTGGTIDSVAYPEDEALYPAQAVPSDNNNGAYHVVLRLIAGHEIEVDWTSICSKDSKDFNDDDLSALRQAVLAADGYYDRVIVTSGTDRMADIARKLAAPSCPVVFTGAIWPLANGPKSDGPANLKRAIFDRPDLKAGIYIVMGDVFEDAKKVQKNFEQKRFEVVRELS